MSDLPITNSPLNFNLANTVGLFDAGSKHTTNVGKVIINGDYSGETVIPGTHILSGNSYLDGNAIAENIAKDILEVVVFLETVKAKSNTFPIDVKDTGIPPGVYSYTLPSLEQDFKFDGRGNPTSQWIIILSSSTVTFVSSFNMILVGEAKPCNIYWVASTPTSTIDFESSNTLYGNIINSSFLSSTKLRFNSVSPIVGRVFNFNGDIGMEFTSSSVVTVTIPDEVDGNFGLIIPPIGNVVAGSQFDFTVEVYSGKHCTFLRAGASGITYVPNRFVILEVKLPLGFVITKPDSVKGQSNLSYITIGLNPPEFNKKVEVTVTPPSDYLGPVQIQAKLNVTNPDDNLISQKLYGAVVASLINTYISQSIVNIESVKRPLPTPILAMEIKPNHVDIGSCVTIKVVISGGNNPRGKLTFVIIHGTQASVSQQKICDGKARFKFSTTDVKPGKYYVLVNYPGDSQNSQACINGSFRVVGNCD
jgi:hypothetical protein